MKNKAPKTSRTNLAVVLLVVPLVAIGSLLTSCGDKKSAGTDTGTSTSAASKGAFVVPAGTPVQFVTLKSLRFSPNNIVISAGTKVVFVWKEHVAHNVVFKDLGINSGVMNDKEFAIDMTKLAKPGVYKYTCTLHPGMDGTITVI